MTDSPSDKNNQGGKKKPGGSDVKIIVPPNSIAKKVTRGGFGAVDAAALKRAEEAIQNMGDDYLSWVEKDLARMLAAYERLQNGEDPKPILEELFKVAHDIKGQGGSFGFDLMTQLGNQLCRLIDAMDGFGPREKMAIELHIDAMRNVVHQRIKGAGREQDAAVLEGLQSLVNKLAERN